MSHRPWGVRAEPQLYDFSRQARAVEAGRSLPIAAFHGSVSVYC